MSTLQQIGLGFSLKSHFHARHVRPNKEKMQNWGKASGCSLFCDSAQPKHQEPPLTRIAAKCFLLIRLMFQGGQSCSFVSRWFACVKASVPFSRLHELTESHEADAQTRRSHKSLGFEGFDVPRIFFFFLSTAWLMPCNTKRFKPPPQPPSIPVCAVRGLAFPGVPLMMPVWSKGPINRTGAQKMGWRRGSVHGSVWWLSMLCDSSGDPDIQRINSPLPNSTVNPPLPLFSPH